nr:MAG TPA: hypothetical protein [Caudoviricetes sp.]
MLRVSHPTAHIAVDITKTAVITSLTSYPASTPF